MDDDSSERINAHTKVVFTSKDMTLDLRHTCTNDSDVAKPEIKIRLSKLKDRGMLGPAAVADFDLTEGQVVYFVLRQKPEDDHGPRDFLDSHPPPENQAPKDRAVSMGEFREAAHLRRPAGNPIMSVKLLEDMVNDTNDFWNRWIAKCKYRGRWREAVRRSALTL